jgi:signal transduction histidine kinase
VAQSRRNDGGERAEAITTWMGRCRVDDQVDSARSADRLKSELLGIVSHELRSPLTAIKGYAATLLRHDQRLPCEERREFLAAIGQASDRLQEVIDRLLELAQLEAGAVRLERFPLDLLPLVRDAVAAAECQSEDRAPGRFSFWVTCEADSTEAPPTEAPPTEAPPTEAPPTEAESIELLVRGDARRLRTVFDHLLENAVKYSPDGGTIAVAVRAILPDGHLPGADGADHSDGPNGPSVEVEVSDGGVGIPAEHLERVFDRFHRVDTRLARDAEGLGLGLAIARRIVELHGGSIWAENVAAGGSLFHIVLPLAPIEAVEAEGNADVH